MGERLLWRVYRRSPPEPGERKGWVRVYGAVGETEAEVVALVKAATVDIPTDKWNAIPVEEGNLAVGAYRD